MRPNPFLELLAIALLLLALPVILSIIVCNSIYSVLAKKPKGWWISNMLGLAVLTVIVIVLLAHALNR